MGGCKRVFKGIWGTTVVRGGGYIQVSCRNSLDELLGGGMIREWETGGKFLCHGRDLNLGPGAWSCGI